MLSISLLLAFGLLCFVAGRKLLGLRRNMAAAKQSGLPYIIVPVYQWDLVWLTTHKMLMPLLQRLPSSLTGSFIDYIDPEWNWQQGHAPFEALGSDVIVLVSPNTNTVYVADASAATQIATRRADFPKPTDMYSMLDIYGKNVVSTESSVWRHHRRIAAVPFTERSNALVFGESITQAQSMLASWGDGPIDTVAQDAMRLSLHVISRAGFGVALSWPHEDLAKAVDIPAGHSMAYKDAVSLLLSNLEAIIVLPKWLLRNGTKQMRIAHEAYVEWGKYMSELYQSKREAIRSGEVQDSGALDLMGALCHGAGLTAESLAAAEDGKPAAQLLTDDEIMGNAFVFMLAGHETTANVIHYSLVFLALHGPSQRRVQADIDALFGDRDPSQWNYDADIPKLFGNMVGAVMNETLRVAGGVVNIPKTTPPGKPQPLTLASGKRVVIPGGSFVNLTTTALHLNPRYWTSPELKGQSAEAIRRDIHTFRPERWILRESAAAKSSSGLPRLDDDDDAANDSNDEHGGPGGRDTSEHLFRPERGAYIPFSEGARACVGRRFAQVESLAVLAVLLRTHTVELAVDAWATDEQLREMSDAQKQDVFGKAATRAQYLFRHGMETRITLQMRDGVVPLRLRRRGAELLGGDASALGYP